MNPTSFEPFDLLSIFLSQETLNAPGGRWISSQRSLH